MESNVSNLLIAFIIQLSLYICSSYSLETNRHVDMGLLSLIIIKFVDKKKNLNTWKDKMHAQDKLTIKWG